MISIASDINQGQRGKRVRFNAKIGQCLIEQLLGKSSIAVDKIRLISKPHCRWNKPRGNSLLALRHVLDDFFPVDSQCERSSHQRMVKWRLLYIDPEKISAQKRPNAELLLFFQLRQRVDRQDRKRRSSPIEFVFFIHLQLGIIANHDQFNLLEFHAECIPVTWVFDNLDRIGMFPFFHQERPVANKRLFASSPVVILEVVLFMNGKENRHSHQFLKISQRKFELDLQRSGIDRFNSNII